MPGYKFTDEEKLNFLNYLEKNFRAELLVNDISKIVNTLNEGKLQRQPLKLSQNKSLGGSVGGSRPALTLYYLFKQALEINIAPLFKKSATSALYIKDYFGCPSPEDPFPITVNQADKFYLSRGELDCPLYLKLDNAFKVINTCSFWLASNTDINIYLPDTLNEIKFQAFALGINPGNSAEFMQNTTLYFHPKNGKTGFSVPTIEADLYKKVLKAY